MIVVDKEVINVLHEMMGRKGSQGLFTSNQEYYAVSNPDLMVAIEVNAQELYEASKEHEGTEESLDAHRAVRAGFRFGAMFVLECFRRQDDVDKTRNLFLEG